MLWNPAAAPLAAGIYGDGSHLMAKLQKSFNLKGEKGTGAGFVLWAPEYHPDINKLYPGTDDFADGYEVKHRNLFIGYTTESGVSMTNTADLPFGGIPLGPDQSPGATGRVATSDDPAGAFLESNLVAAARTVAASMKMTYTGALLDMGGQVCSITSFPAEALILGAGKGNPDFSFTVDELFSWSEQHDRVQSDTLEVVHQPTATSNLFRDSTTSPFQFGVTGPMGPAQVPLPRATPTILNSVGQSQQPTLMGFAWRGLPSTTTSPMTFDLLKVVEWKPRPVSGIVGGSRNPSVHSVIPPVHAARAQLDARRPGWAARAFRAIEKEAVRFGPQLASYIASGALAEATGGMSLIGAGGQLRITG
jgi:hypothetical protein